MHPPDRPELAEIHAALEALAQQLHSFLADETGATNTVELDQSTQGRVSRIDALQQQKMAEAERRRAAVRLTRVRTVLEGWTDPNVEPGTCRDCGEDIVLARLRATPDALFCIECAREREAARR